MLEGLGHLHPGAFDTLADARDVELRRGQQAAQLVVQLARQVAALVFAHALQVLGDVHQLLRAAIHLGLELVALGAELHQVQPAIVLARAADAQHHETRRHAQQHQDGDADAAAQVHVRAQILDAAVGLGLLGPDLVGDLVDADHGLAADLGHHQLDGACPVAGAESLQHLGHLGPLAPRRLGQRFEPRALLRVALGHRLHSRQQRLELPVRRGVRLQVGVALGEDVAALGRFHRQCHQPHLVCQRAGFQDHGVLPGEALDRVVADLVDRQQQHGQHHGEAPERAARGPASQRVRRREHRDASSIRRDHPTCRKRARPASESRPRARPCSPPAACHAEPPWRGNRGPGPCCRHWWAVYRRPAAPQVAGGAPPECPTAPCRPSPTPPQERCRRPLAKPAYLRGGARRAE